MDPSPKRKRRRADTFARRQKTDAATIARAMDVLREGGLDYGIILVARVVNDQDEDSSATFGSPRACLTLAEAYVEDMHMADADEEPDEPGEEDDEGDEFDDPSTPTDGGGKTVRGEE